jgi:putative restriction endonuclease
MNDLEIQIRLAAFDWLRSLIESHGETLDYTVLNNGFIFKGQQVHMIGQTGIWKPKQCKYPIAVTTSTKGVYEDQYDEDDEYIVYKYRGTDPNHHDNVGLRNLILHNLPLIYYKGISRGKYIPIFPVYIHHDDPANLQVFLQVEERKNYIIENQLIEANEPVRKYMTSIAKKRLHQQEFRSKVLKAYNCKCAFCRIKHLPLLDAAHIIPDSEPNGQPIVSNGLSLCKIHHAAFDANIMGVSPDYKIIVKEDILNEIDGPMLKHGIIELHNSNLILPRVKSEHPDKDRLESRFEKFRRAG